MIRDRHLFLDILALFFGISAWISINGIWVELPLLVQELPEAWSLASYLSIIVQIANLGPISYSLFRWLSRGRRDQQSRAIYFLFVIGTLSSIFLAIFWDRTTFILGSERSSALFALVFCLSLVDCTSSVLFLPYMSIFREMYLNSYLIGEGLSGFIPSVAALVQGVGGNPECRNVSRQTNDTDNPIEYVIQKVNPEPNFSVESFFFFLFVMMVISFVAFLLMDLLPSMKNDHDLIDDKTDDNEDETNKSMILDDCSTRVRLPATNLKTSNLDENGKEITSNVQFYLLLLLQAYVCFVSNGAFPSIATYSSLPYGNTVYHLSATLHAMANPVMAFFAFFVPCHRINWIGLLTIVGSGFAGFLLATALNSPDMLFGSDVGGSLTVLSWVIYSGLFSYVKVSIAGCCRKRSEESLFWCGVVTQAGSALGAFVMFFLVNMAHGVFVGYNVEC